MTPNKMKKAKKLSVKRLQKKTLIEKKKLRTQEKKLKKNEKKKPQPVETITKTGQINLVKQEKVTTSATTATAAALLKKKTSVLKPKTNKIKSVSIQ